MHFSAPTLDAGGVITAIGDHVSAAMWNHTLTTRHVHELVATPLDGSGLSIGTPTGDGAIWSGSRTATQTVPQVAALVHVGTQYRGRSFRGRVYLPWCAEDAISNGYLDGGVRTGMNDAWDLFLSGLATDGVAFGVASYTLAEFTPANDLVVELALATIRRRQPR